MTPAQRRALEALAALTEDGRGTTPRSLARRLWPDSPGWRRTGHRHDGKAGAMGATMWLNGARMLHRLDALGLAWMEDTGTSYVWHVTAKGRAALNS